MKGRPFGVVGFEIAIFCIIYGIENPEFTQFAFKVSYQESGSPIKLLNPTIDGGNCILFISSMIGLFILAFTSKDPP